MFNDEAKCLQVDLFNFFGGWNVQSSLTKKYVFHQEFVKSRMKGQDLNF